MGNMSEYKISYNPELVWLLSLRVVLSGDRDTYQLYHRYEETPPKDDWKTAALRGPALPALGNAVAGAVGAAVSNLATYPLSLIIARLQTQSQRKKDKGKGKGKSEGDDDDVEDDEEYTDFVDAARKIYAREGLGSFYTGLAQDTVKTVADSFLFFLAYGFFRQRRINARFGASRRSKHTVLPVLDELAVGVLAGAFAKLFTTPLANIVARKQTSKASVSARDIAAKIKAEKGLRGFWSGYSASLILTLNPSITFFLNEVLKYGFLRRNQRGGRSSSAIITFLLAAISKSAASSVTYPFSMAKTRAQVTGSNAPASGKSAENGEKDDADEGISLTPAIISNVIAIARTDGVSALYAGLPGEILKGFFSHGFTMLAKDAIYSAIVHSYYLLLVVLRRYPTPEELIERAHEQAEEWADAAREGARDLADKARQDTGHMLDSHSGNVAVEMTSTSGPGGVDFWSDSNETAEMVGDYVEDEAAEWRSLYHWFWEKEKYGKE